MNCSVRIPHTDFLSEKFPEEAGKNHINLVHVNKNSVVLLSLMNNKPIEVDEVLDSRLLLFLSKRKHVDVLREVVFTLKETDNMNRFAVLCKFCHPTMKEAENRVVLIEFLRGYK